MMALPTALNARCLRMRLENAIDAVTRHPSFNTIDPRRSNYSLHCLWDTLHRTRSLLLQIDFGRLDARDPAAVAEWVEVFGRAQMACPLMSEPTGLMLNTIMGNPNAPSLDLGEDIRRAGALLMPDTKTGQYTENPADQQNLEEIIDLDGLLPGFNVRDTLEEAAKEDSEAKEKAKSESEGEWEEGADDSDWEDMGPDMPPADRSPLMEMPRELREEIYAYLVVADRTKQPPLHLLPYCPMQNQWNLATNFLRVNKQVHEEALGVLGRQNKFVVVERATRKLKSTPEDRQDGGFPNCPIWIGRAKWEAKAIPGEVMRVKFSEKNKKVDPKDIDYFILLVEELETLCINLSRYVTGGVYRTNGLVCEVSIAPPREAETKTVMHRREDALLNPLARLRAFAMVNIQGASPEKTMNTVMQMKRKEQTAFEAVRTGEQIAVTAEAYNRVGYHFMSNSYLDWGTMLMGFYENDLLQGEMSRQESRKSLFVRFLLQKAHNHLRLGDYERAMEVGNDAVQFCREVGGMPEWREFPGVDQSQRRGVVKRGDFMKWATKTTLDRLAAPPNRNAITPVDAARAFWYRAMAIVMLQGNSIMEETDRMFAISLLDNVGKRDVANELVALAEDLEDEDPEIVKDNEAEFKGLISYPSRHARRFADGSFAPTDIPGYNIRTWERPYPPIPQPRHLVTDGGMEFLFSRINSLKGAPERFPGTRYTDV